MILNTVQEYSLLPLLIHYYHCSFAYCIVLLPTNSGSMLVTSRRPIISREMVRYFEILVGYTNGVSWWYAFLPHTIHNPIALACTVSLVILLVKTTTKHTEGHRNYITACNWIWDCFFSLVTHHNLIFCAPCNHSVTCRLRTYVVQCRVNHSKNCVYCLCTDGVEMRLLRIICEETWGTGVMSFQPDSTFFNINVILIGWFS